MRDLEDIIIEMKDAPPLSSYHQIEEFEKTTIHQDLQRLWTIWIDNFRNLHEDGRLNESHDYFRGAINALKQVKKSTADLKDAIEQEEEE